MAAPTITGICLREERLEWTTLRRRKGGWRVASSGQRDLPREDEGRETARAEYSRMLKKAMGDLPGRISAGLPSGMVLLRVVELPSSDAQELAGMVELQVDKFAPFALEQMAVSYEVLRSEDNRSRVLIAAVHSEKVEEFGSRLRAGGVLPQWIDVEAMGWWRLLQQRGAIAEHGRQMVIVAGEHAAEIMAADEGTLVLVRVVDAGTAEVGELAEEVGYTLTGLETEWGPPPGDLHLDVWREGESSGELEEALREVCGVAPGMHRCEELGLPSEGLAWRRADGGGQALNLVPSEWHAAAKARRVKRRLAAMALAVLGLWLAGAGVVVGRLKMEQRQLAELKKAAAALAGPAEEVRRLQEKVHNLELYSDRTYSVLECLREVSALLPGGVDLTSFVYRKSHSIHLRGEATRTETIYDFISAMEKSQLFDKVKPEGVSTRRRGRQMKTEFKLTATLPGGEK